MHEVAHASDLMTFELEEIQRMMQVGRAMPHFCSLRFGYNSLLFQAQCFSCVHVTNFVEAILGQKFTTG